MNEDEDQPGRFHLIERHGWIVLPLALAILIWAGTPVIDAFDGFDFDGRYYAAAADPNSPFAALRGEPPYAWRVLTPWLVAQLPVPLFTGFRMLAFAASAASLMMMSVLLRGLGFSGRTWAFGLLLYAGIFWTIKFAAYSSAYIDVETQLFVIAIIWSIFSQSWKWIPLLMTIGVLQKESIAVFIPVAFLAHINAHGKMSAGSGAFLCWMLVPSLAALLVVRTLVHTTSNYSPLLAMGGYFYYQVTDPQFWPRFALELFSGLGILPLLIMTRPGETGRWLRERPHWGVFIAIIAVSLFGGLDKARLFLPLVPLLVILCLQAGKAYLEQPHRAVNVWIGGTLVIHFLMGHQLTPISSYDDYLASMVPIHWTGSLGPQFLWLSLLVALWALLQFYLIRSLPAPSRGNLGA
jgi:hypothetical protein